MFTPVVPLPGLAGWRFLQKTYDSQFETFGKNTVLQRDTAYFREKIGKVTTAEELVSDRRLLTVALGAFGLQDDINNRYFIQKVLEEGTVAKDSLANRFSDVRYRELSKAFGFGPEEFLKVGESDFVEAIVSRFETNSFEVATGEANESMRVALYGQRELAQLATDDMSNDAKWFTLLADPPLRKMMEAALNLPKSVGQIDIDQQLVIFKDRARSVLGSDKLDEFKDPERIEEVVTKFVIRDQINEFSASTSRFSIALTLLQNIR